MRRGRVGEHIPLRGFPTIPRADVAAAMLDELEAPRFVGKGALLAS